MARTEIVTSPGAWQPPPRSRPAWDWIPPDHRLTARLDRVPQWVRVWFRTPFLDRFAYSWMWNHGGWDVLPPFEGGPEASGVRVPLTPDPSPPALRVTREPADD